MSKVSLVVSEIANQTHRILAKFEEKKTALGFKKIKQV